MKYIKKFENINREPEVGDYIVINYDDRAENKDAYKFFSTHVGEILDYRYTENDDCVFPIHIRAKYAEEYNERKISSYNINYKMIGCLSKNKEECEEYLITKKYNL